VNAAAPAPTINSITPNPLTTTAATWMTVNGTGFQSGFSATVSGYSIASTGLQFVSSTQVKISVSMASGNYSAPVVITNPDGQHVSGSFQVNAAAPAPTISSITPNPLTTTAATWMTVNGTGFQSGFSATVSGYSIASTGLQFVSSTQVKINVGMGKGSYSAPVVVTNPDGQHASGSFQVSD
jgi:nitrogen regulatory protein PII